MQEFIKTFYNPLKVINESFDVILTLNDIQVLTNLADIFYEYFTEFDFFHKKII